MSARLLRVARLLEVSEKAVNAARAAAAAATRTVVLERERLQVAERAWSDAAARFGNGVTRSTDLNEQSAHLRTLRLRADERAKVLERAIAEERRSAAAVVQAATEQRKLELLRDRIVQAQREEDNRQERRGSDELAARTARSRA